MKKYQFKEYFHIMIKVKLYDQSIIISIIIIF